MKEKMKRDRDEKFFFLKMFENPQTMFRKKSLSDELFLHFFCKSSESGRFSIIYMIRIRFFWAQGIKSEGVSGGTVSFHHRQLGASLLGIPR